MRMQWSIAKLMGGLHQRVARDLDIARNTLGHPVSLGSGSEQVWLSMLNEYLPKRYVAHSAAIIDSQGDSSEQIDVVVYDRQYSPLMFAFKGQLVVPAEAVYAVFEAKQELTRSQIIYAQKKVASVRKLLRTSVPVGTIDGVRVRDTLPQILGGFLAFDCRWKRPFDKTLQHALGTNDGPKEINLGCIATRGIFRSEQGDVVPIRYSEKAVTMFLMELLSCLQEIGTVPAIDFRAYSKWL